MAEQKSHVHALCDLTGIDRNRLRDPGLLAGLLIAAAGAIGAATLAPPSVQQQPDDRINCVLLLDSGHLALHALPDRGLLMLDVLASSAHDVQRAVEVFRRRLVPAGIAQEQRARG
jgi:S-adenosylmethionine/arginine decarboxylase-like enzyme